jgi:hypothetical protein
MYDYYWNPSKCIDCKGFHSCISCFHTKSAKLNLKNILLYSDVPELWNIFNDVINISQVSEAGLTLSGMEVYLKGSSYLSRYRREDFWLAMGVFLNETNSYYHRKKKEK